MVIEYEMMRRGDNEREWDSVVAGPDIAQGCMTHPRVPHQIYYNIILNTEVECEQIVSFGLFPLCWHYKVFVQAE